MPYDEKNMSLSKDVTARKSFIDLARARVAQN
jgi:hypothetical protein